MKMNNQDFQSVSRMLKVISQTHRLKIMWLCLDSTLSVSELVDELGDLSQSLVSHHLKQLRDANLICDSRDGKRVRYHVTDECIRCILRDIMGHTVGKHKQKQTKG